MTDGDLTALAGQYQELRGRVDQLGTDLAEHLPSVVDQQQTLTEHTQMLSDLGESLLSARTDLDELLEERPPDAKWPLLCWPTMSAEDVAREFTALGEWVRDVLVPWYHPSRGDLPDCWPLHLGAMAELSALERLWRHAYSGRVAVSVAEWHTRWRGDLLTGVSAAVRREATALGRQLCSVGFHLGAQLPGAIPPPPPPAPTPAPAPGLTTTPGMPSTPGMPPPAGAWAPPLSQPAGPGAHGELAAQAPEAALADPTFWWPHLVAARDEMVRSRRAAEIAPNTK